MPASATFRVRRRRHFVPPPEFPAGKRGIRKDFVYPCYTHEPVQQFIPEVKNQQRHRPLQHKVKRFVSQMRLPHPPGNYLGNLLRKKWIYYRDDQKKQYKNEGMRGFNGPLRTIIHAPHTAFAGKFPIRAVTRKYDGMRGALFHT